MKLFRFSSSTMVVLLGLYIPLSAADNSAVNLPHLIVTPQKPLAGIDSITVAVVLGRASNLCMAPTFSNRSFTVTLSPLEIYPPVFIVDVRFTEVPVSWGCSTEYDPVDYGPMFQLGVLQPGTYRVVQDNGPAGTLVTYGEFQVLEAYVKTIASFKSPVAAHDVSRACYSLNGALLGRRSTAKTLTTGFYTTSVHTASSGGGIYVVEEKCSGVRKRFTTMSIDR